jgi:magnesium chelatase family protein
MCDTATVQRYLNKISGPLLDRIDLHLQVTPVSFERMAEDSLKKDKSSVIRARVVKARAIQQERFKNFKNIYANALMPPAMVKKVCPIPKAGHQLLKDVTEKLGLSARAYDRILKVSRTIADLAGDEHITEMHLGEAIFFRSLDRDNWGT